MATEDRLVSWNRSRKDISSLGANAINIPVKLVIWPLGFKEIPGALDGSWDSNCDSITEHSVCGAYADHVLIIRWSCASQTTSKAWKMACKPQCSALIELHHGMDFAKSKMERLKAAERRIFLRPKVMASLLGTKSKSLQKIPCFIIFFRGSLLHNATTCHDLRGFEWSA